jgi:hypothetical protein
VSSYPDTLIGPKPKGNDPVNVIDPKFFNEVAQFAHAGVAGLIYLSLAHIAMKFDLFKWSWYGALIVIGVAAAGVKEFWYDPHYENVATRGSDFEDFAFYLVGILIAVAVIVV